MRKLHGSDIYETPPGGVSINNPGTDVRVGACRYQRRSDPESVQPEGMKAALPFFKGEDFDIENEFRLLLNPYTGNTMTRTREDGTPNTFRPTGPKFRIYPLDMKTQYLTKHAS